MGRIYRTQFKCRHVDGTLVQPSLHYQTDLNTLEGEPDPGDVAGDLWGKLGTTFLSCLHSNFTVDELVVLEEVLKPDIGVAGGHIVGSSGTFSSGSASLPKALAAVVNVHTKERSRSARGWFRMPSPLAASFVNGDVWASNVTSALGSLAALLDDTVAFGGVGTGHYNPVVYSRTRHQRGEEPYTFRVTSATVNPKIHWLRSRTTNP